MYKVLQYAIIKQKKKKHCRGFLGRGGEGGRWEKSKDNDCSKNSIHGVKQNTKPLAKAWITKLVYEGQVINLALTSLIPYTKHFIISQRILAYPYC